MTGSGSNGNRSGKNAAVPKNWENNEGVVMAKVFLTDAAADSRDSRYLGLESHLFAYVFM